MQINKSEYPALYYHSLKAHLKHMSMLLNKQEHLLLFLFSINRSGKVILNWQSYRYSVVLSLKAQTNNL